jgi:exonuclease SbcC
VLLWGSVGSGKSSILLAIEFALFGLIRGSMSGASLLRHGEKEGHVELCMDIEGKNVIIKRSLRRTKNTIQQDFGYISIDGNNRHGTAVELKSWILDLLGYPKSLLSKSKSLIYRYTVYTPQEETKRILLEDEEQRLDTLRRVFQIDKYKRARENTLILVRMIKQRIKELKAQIIDLEEKLKEKNKRDIESKELQQKEKEEKPKLTEIKNKVDEQKNKVIHLEKNVTELNKITGQLEVEEVILKGKISQQQQNKKEFEVIQEQLGELHKKLEEINIKDIEEEVLEKDIEQQERELNKIKEENIILNAKISMMKIKEIELESNIKAKSRLSKDFTEKSALMEQLHEKIQGKLELMNGIRELEKELEELNKQLYEANIKVKQSEELKKKVSSLYECPICLQPVSSSHKKHIDDVEGGKMKKYEGIIHILKNKKMGMLKVVDDLKGKFDRINEEEKRYVELRSEVNALKNICEELMEKQIEFSKISEEKKDAEKRIATIKELPIEERIAKVDELKRLLEKLKEKDMVIKLLEEKNKRMNDISKNIGSIKKEIGSINVKKIELNDKLKSLKGAREQYDNEKTELDRLMRKEKELEVGFAVLQKELEGVENIKKLLGKEIKQKEKSKECIKKLDAMRDWLEKTFINVLVIMEKNVMLKVYNEFNELFRGWFNLLIEEEELTVRLNDEFKPIVEQNGYETDIGNLSGGEKTALALAYRLSLNKVINDVVEGIKTKDIIILDEPTDGLSTEQLDKMREILDQLDIQQIIIVSHERKIESYVDNVLRVNKNEHVSHIVETVV